MESENNSVSENGKNISASGANPDLPGFSEKSLDRHWGGVRDHSDQYEGLTKEQYAERAVELARSAVGGDIDGYKSTQGKFKGSIVRYNRSTNDWVRVYPTSGIATMFKPEDNADYFERLKTHETR